MVPGSLVKAVRQEIKGIQTGKAEVKVFLFGDDMVSKQKTLKILIENRSIKYF